VVLSDINASLSLVLAWSAALAAVGLALLVFTLIARPERLYGTLARWVELDEAYELGRLGVADEERLERFAQRLVGPALVLLFAWSFLAGALVVWSRLPGSR
jgi:hypothetical protein